VAAELDAAGQPGAIAHAIESGGAAVTITAIPTTCQKSRRVATTIFRWILPTRQPMAMDGKFGPPGRSPKGLFRLVHNCQ